MHNFAISLWFDNNAEEAVRFYTGLFPGSSIDNMARYGEAGPGVPGTVMAVNFHMHGQEFLAINGGPVYSFTPAISFIVYCETQAEVDHYWQALTAGGQEVQCGWLTDRYGLSWQIVPTVLGELMSDPDPEKAQRVTEAMLKMVKLDIAGLRQAYAGI